MGGDQGMHAYLVFSPHALSRVRLGLVNLQLFEIAGSENNGTAGRSIMIDAMGPVRGPVFAKIPSENSQPMDIDVTSFVNDAISSWHQRL